MRLNHIPLFHYNTLYTALLRDTKSLLVQLNRPKHDNCINLEMIFELESLVVWLSEHPEVHSVILTGQGDIFSRGLDWDEFEDLNEKRFLNAIKKFQKIICRMFDLPQTIIVDYKQKAVGAGFELGLGADIRITHQDSWLQLSSLHQGLVSVCGGLGLLEQWVGKAHARNWQLSSKAIPNASLLKSGYIMSEYVENNDFSFELREEVFRQSPAARIQTKLALRELFTEEGPGNVTSRLEKNLNFANAAHEIKDWKLAREKKEPVFMAAREIQEMLKQE